MAMCADAVDNPVMLIKNNGSLCRKYIFHHNHNKSHHHSHIYKDNKYNIHASNVYLVRLIIDSLISRLLLSSCILSGTSIFSYNLFCWGETGWNGKEGGRGVFAGQLSLPIKKLVLVRRLAVRRPASGSWSGGIMTAGGKIILIIGAMIMPGSKHGWTYIPVIWKITEKATRNTSRSAGRLRNSGIEVKDCNWTYKTKWRNSRPKL